jgi:uncharacterized protein
MDPRLAPAAVSAPAVLGAILLASCIARNAPPDKGPGAPPAGATAAAPPPATAAAPVAPAPPPATTEMAPPPDYIRMQASDVVPTREGEAVLLIDEKETIAIPIFIGGSEATSIRLRLQKRRYERPLTHDLFDALMHEVGAQLLKVQVDDLKSSTYLGSVFVRAAGRVFELDARPSDAIALAVGNRVPIFVACRVIEAAAIPQKSILEGPRAPESDLQVEGCPPKSSPPAKTTGAGI